MTMHADQLVGAPVTDSDGLAVGTVEQVFRDDVDGTPSWARIRSSKGLHFVPLANSTLTSGGGLSVPFDSQKILTEPDFSVDRHMSVEQEEDLRRYFGLSVPAQAPPAETETMPAAETAGTGRTKPDLARPAQPDQPAQPASARTQEVRQSPGGNAGQEWLIRSEERIAVNLETRETGRIKLHKYVDTEQIAQTVRVYREEYEIERVPVTSADQISGDLAEVEQEIILHEAQAVVTKESVPVERVRLSVRRVEEEKQVGGEIRKERIEIDSAASGSGQAGGQSGQGQGQGQGRSGQGQPGSGRRR